MNTPILLRGLFFLAWSSLTSLKSQTLNLRLKVPPGRFMLRIFTSWKIHRHQPNLNPRTLDLEASTLPRDYRGRRRQLKNLIFLARYISLSSKKWINIDWRNIVFNIPRMLKSAGDQKIQAGKRSSQLLPQEYRTRKRVCIESRRCKLLKVRPSPWHLKYD